MFINHCTLCTKKYTSLNEATIIPQCFGIFKSSGAKKRKKLKFFFFYCKISEKIFRYKCGLEYCWR